MPLRENDSQIYIVRQHVMQHLPRLGMTPDTSTCCAYMSLELTQYLDTTSRSQLSAMSDRASSNFSPLLTLCIPASLFVLKSLYSRSRIGFIAAVFEKYIRWTEDHPKEKAQ